MNKNAKSILQENYEAILTKIDGTTKKVGRSLDSIKLIVVTKTQPIDVVWTAILAGVKDLGENYAEEAVMKINSIGPIPELTWHMIGHIQSRKAGLVSRYFDYVHTIDSLKLAGRIDRFAGDQMKKLPTMLECNVGGEMSKFGYPIFDKTKWDELSREILEITHLPNLSVIGLMTMPPLSQKAEDSRPYFRLLCEFRDYLKIRIPQVEWKELSMGTSSDFNVAIEEGATIIRIGTAILGTRPHK